MKKTIAILLFMFMGFLCADELNTLLASTTSVCHFDPFLKTGLIRKKDTSVCFRIGSPFYVVNGNLIRVSDSPERKDGKVIFTDKASSMLTEILATAKVSSRVAYIVIDAGHGGADPGTLSTHKIGGKNITIKEKDIVLKTALYLQALLTKNFPDKKIIMTRSTDIYPTLEQRTATANGIVLAEGDAILFISIHANGSFSAAASGFELWTLPKDYERTVDTSGSGVTSLLNDLKQEEFDMESGALAAAILKRMEESLGKNMLNRGIKEESWYVVRKANMASVLLEIGFISNKEDATLMADDSYLKKTAQAIYNGLGDFIAQFER